MHAIEAELRGPTPRRARPRGKPVRLWWRLLGVLCIPHVMIGACLLLFCLSTLLLPLGTVVNAQVTGHRTSRGSKGGISYQVMVTYPFRGLVAQANESVSAATYDTIKVGGTLPLLIHPFGWYTVLIVDGWPQVQFFFFVWFFMLFWNTIVGALVWSFWGRLMAERWLVARGVPAQAQIRDIRQVKGTFYVDYDFTLEGRVSKRGSMTVETADALAATAGQAVTVLYSARCPLLNIVYDFAHWTAAEAPRPLGFALQ